MHLLLKVALGALFLVSVASWSLMAFRVDDRTRSRTCQTRGCIEQARILKEDMDESVSPCDDFYEFACGNYIRKAVIPGDQQELSKFTVVRNLLDDQLHEILEHGITYRDLRPFRLAKMMYDSCMVLSYIEETSEGEVKDLLKKFGGWPVLEGDAWNERNYAWDETGFLHLKYGQPNSYFVNWAVNNDLKNTSKQILFLQQADMTLDKTFFADGWEDDNVKAYHDYMVDVAVMLGANRKRAENELREAINVEIALAEIAVPEDQLRDRVKFYHLTQISELRTNYPDYDWARYVNRMLEGHTQLKGDDIINVAQPEYLAKVTEVISKFPKRVQSNYAHMRVVENLVSTMGENYQKREFEFKKQRTGETEMEPRFKTCVKSIDDTPLSLATNALFVRRFFDDRSKKAASDMINRIKSAFRNILINVEWMDEKTRSAALEKLDHMYAHVAYPDEFTQDSTLENYFEKLGPFTDSFLHNTLSLAKFQLEEALMKLTKPSDKLDWKQFTNILTVNAFYGANDNTMNIPVGILQIGFFRNDLPAYMNYGGLGTIVGHEITHGFDDMGRQFDKVGNLVDWWEEETKERYLERAQCIKDQYSNYTVPEVELNVNGESTLGENIADNSGFKAAYYAYKDYAKSHGVELPLPGFSHYKPEQFFWISAANVWCSSARIESLKNQIIGDEHTPDKYRIIGTFSNMREFARDFNCPRASPLNPEKKCNMW